MQSNQKLAAQQMTNINDKDQLIYKKALYLEYNKITNDLYTNFKDQLQNILENVKLSQSLETIFHLLTFQQRCIRNFCYENPHFKVLNASSITATFQKSFQTLKRAIYVTCTISAQGYTSAYSNNFGLLQKDDTILFRDNSLKSLKRSELLHPKIDKIKKKIDKNECLLQELCPIFSGNQVSFQCQNVTYILIDNVRHTCGPTILNFQPFPAQIVIHNKNVNFRESQHFSLKLDEFANNHKQISLFQPRDVNSTIFQKIGNFIQFASPHHKWAIFSGALTIFLTVVLMCFLIACLKPQILEFFCKCFFGKNCCCRKLLRNQINVREQRINQEEINLHQPLTRPTVCIVENPSCRCLTPNWGACRGRIRV